MRLTIREALLAFRRAPLLSALSIMMIAFSLFSFGLYGLVVLNFQQRFGEVEERVEIEAFVSDSTSVETLATAVGAIAKYPEVQRAAPVTKDEALARARRDMGEFADVYDAAFLPASIEVRLAPGFRDPATVKKVADRIAGSYGFVDDVRYGEEFVQQLFNIRTVATATGIVLGVAFAAVAIIIIASTIRITVMSRAREISIMRLVGATDGFVRGPFLLEGLATGIMGGLFALLLLWVAHGVVSRVVAFDIIFLDRPLAVAGILSGGLLGIIGSAFAVRRYLRRV
ncbi:MAG TPA: permease-like cell division protein FtsX [Gemmatimonadaceae bacterium]|nr:permease-like cell division protein FtsX [Gemmatimonadaceae bacterium]